MVLRLDMDAKSYIGKISEINPFEGKSTTWCWKHMNYDIHLRGYKETQGIKSCHKEYIVYCK